MINLYLKERIENNAPFYDELADADGTIRPHWQKLARSYEELGLEKMGQLKEEVAHELRDNGVTYNIYGDPDGMNRPWQLDPVPMVFSQTEWESIEKGLVQRAELLNLILSDIYGERKLISNGLIPFELIYNHKGFLRQVDKIKMPGKHQLIQYSADIARGPNGKVWVLHDRTDAPSGAGYTLENRASMTHVFPELIRENEVRKISSYYQTLKNTLNRLSLQNKENPRIVLLSPGTANETYFEHAYLASSLGFTLAIGQDLTVSDGFVWLKTLRGLEKVDVIIRRVDDIFCDPLEFLGSSHLGVVGLMEAVRQKKVIVVNSLGARVLENPGLMAFLPKLCRHLLGEELILPSVATWWCGQDKEKEYVLDNLGYLVIRSIYRSNENKSVFGGDLTKKQLDELRTEIITRPYLYVGQEMVNFSTAPALIDNSLEARNVLFRSYVVADAEKEGYHVMPGGLSRSSPSKGIFIVSNQTGGISKDTWVLGPSPEEAPKMKLTPVVLQQVKNILPSRTGESLFWLGRYLDRAVNTVRLMRLVLRMYHERADEVHPETDQTLVILLKSLSTLTDTLPGFTAADQAKLKKPEEELISIATDASRIGTLAHTLQSFLSNGYAVRDRLSLDTWRILDSVAEELELLRENSKDLRKIYHNLDQLIIKLMAFVGLNNNNMTRASSWRLFNVGRFLESSVDTCTVLYSILGSNNVKPEAERTLMEMALTCNESLITYRYLYRSTLQLHGVLNLLLVYESNPKAVAYLISSIDEHLSHLPGSQSEEGLSPARKKLLEALSTIRLCDIDHLVLPSHHDKTQKELTHLLQYVVYTLNQASTLIYETYFSHTQSQFSFVQNNNLPEL